VSARVYNLVSSGLSFSSLFKKQKTPSQTNLFYYYSPERHGERGQGAPGAAAAARREDANEGRDGREEQQAEDDVAF